MVNEQDHNFLNTATTANVLSVAFVKCYYCCHVNEQAHSVARLTYLKILKSIDKNREEIILVLLELWIPYSA